MRDLGRTVLQVSMAIGGTNQKKKIKIKIETVDEVEWKKMGMKTWSLRLRYCGNQRVGT